MGAVRKDEPLGKSSSLAAVVVSAAVLAGRMLAGGHAREDATGLLSSAVSIWLLSGLGCWTVSRSLACRRSMRACSTGPNTLARSFVRFAFLLLARRPFAILVCVRDLGMCLCMGREYGRVRWRMQVSRSAGGSSGGENAKAGNNNFGGEAPGRNPRRPVLGSRSSPSDADCLGAHTLAAPGTWARRQTRRHRRRRPLDIHREAPLLLLVGLHCTAQHGTRLHGTAPPPTESGSREKLRPASARPAASTALHFTTVFLSPSPASRPETSSSI